MKNLKKVLFIFAILTMIVGISSGYAETMADKAWNNVLIGDAILIEDMNFKKNEKIKIVYTEENDSVNANNIKYDTNNIIEPSNLDKTVSLKKSADNCISRIETTALKSLQFRYSEKT